MDWLPQVLFLDICNYLDYRSLFKLSQVNRNTFIRLRDERFWKQLCLKEFPWFFWNGECAGIHELEYQKRLKPKLTTNAASPLSPSMTTTPTFDRVPKCSIDCVAVTKNPYHPLPDSWRLSFLLIYSGRYSGLFQVINSLEHREMSAFLALATFDYSSNSFAVSYQPLIIAKYRKGEMINLCATPAWVSEIIPMSERIRFRRIPSRMLPYDCREIYTRELFDAPLSSDCRPVFLPGQEVEIQWRSEEFTEYAWWRGVVVCSYLDEAYHADNVGGIVLPNTQFSEDVEQGILVNFPHYPPNSPWSTVVVSNFGNEQLNAIGLVGGIRKVECPWNALQWSMVFEHSVESIRRMLHAHPQQTVNE